MTLNSGANYLKDLPPDATLHFASTRIIKDSVGIQVHLPLFYHHSGPVSDVDMIMHYPATTLKLFHAKLLNGKRFDSPTESWDGRAALHFDADDLARSSDSLLGYINFTWTPLESNCSYVDFDSLY